jgi:hypothetical protein
MPTKDADRYLASHYECENLEDARRLRACAPYALPVEEGEKMLAEADACMRVVRIAREILRLS